MTSAADVSPEDAAAVGAAACRWASERFDSAVTLAEPATPIGGGLDSYIHAVRFAGAQLPPEWTLPLVLRILPTADRLEQATIEATTQTWCATRGIPAPRVLAVAAPGELLHLPVMVMERVPGVTMLDALKARPWRLARLIGALADLHLRLHAVPVAGWPLPTEAGTTLADARLAMVRRLVPRLGNPVLDAALERAEAVVPSLRGSDQVVCHGDFHPLNVLVEGDRTWLIDWTDAALGPREGDVSRTALLFEVASIAASSRLERVVLARLGPRLARRYLRGYEAGAPLDPRLLRRWEALHALHGWTQVVALHSGAFDGASAAASRPAQVPADMAGWLQQRFEASLRD